MTFLASAPPSFAQGGWQLLGGIDNLALVNGTPTLLSVTTPNDGKYHLIIATSRLLVTTLEVGGAVTINFTDGPSGVSGGAFTENGGGQAAGLTSVGRMHILGPLSTIVWAQTSPLTGGAATWCFRVFMAN